MRVIIFFFVMIFGLFTSVVDATPRQAQDVHLPFHGVIQHYQVSAFNRINIQGNINVKLYRGAGRPQVIFHGDPRDLAFVSAVATHGTLQIQVRKGYPKLGPLEVEVRGRDLTSFTYEGTGSVTGKNLRSNGLDVKIMNAGKTLLQGHLVLQSLQIAGGGDVEINGIQGNNLQLRIKDKSKVRLTGIVNLTSLDVNNNGWVSLYWVKSNMLTIRGKGTGYIQLAGIVNQLHVELWNAAYFNGRYLRAKTTFIKTHDRTIAEISTINKQHTLASDASDIRFYNLPTLRSDFMAFNGSVLDMRNWSVAKHQEYTIYNK